MDNILDHKVISSFKEYLSYKLLQERQAYTNKTLPLYQYTPNRRFLGKQTYGSPYSQWVYDSSVSGAQVPTGVSGLSRGQSGMSIDFKNGRLIVNSGVSVSATINVSVPDFNIYVTTTSVQKILLEKKFLYAPDLLAANQPISPDAIVAPCIFISYVNTVNDLHSLGGVDESKFTMQVVVFADNMQKLLGVQRVIRDINRQVFPIIPSTPLNELNDLKYDYWDYRMLLDYIDDPDNFLYVNKTTFRILDLDYINQEHPNIIVGMGSVDLSVYRQSSIGDEGLDFPTIYQEEEIPSLYTFSDGALAEITE